MVALSVEVLSLQCEAYGNLDSFYKPISGRYDKLVATGSDCIPSESLVIAHICKQLPAKYGPIIVKQFSDTKANSIHEFFEHLRLFEMSTKSEEKGSSSGSEASYVVKGKGNNNGQRYGSYGSNPSQRVFRGNCYSCGQKGHMSRTCPKNAPKGNAQQDVGNNAFIMFNGWQQTPAVAFNDSDINGPMEVASLKGMRYIVCFIDDSTRYGVIYLMKAKSEVLDCFKQYIDYMRVRQVTVGTGSTLQSDNDTVYRDKHFSNFCGSLGIDQRFSAPHTQAQNGVAECFWNTIVDAARTMLHSAKLPKSYWGLAVKHATMLRNVSPSSAL